MSRFQVQSAGLSEAAGSLGSTADELAGAAASVRACSGAAAGTPAAGAYEMLEGDSARAVQSLQTAVSGLSRSLGGAATNYTATDESAAACYAPPGG